MSHFNLNFLPPPLLRPPPLRPVPPRSPYPSEYVDATQIAKNKNEICKKFELLNSIAQGEIFNLIITIARIFYLSFFSSPELSDLKTLQTREAKNKSTNVRLKQHNLWYCLISEWFQVYLYVEKRHIVETLAQSSEKVRVRRERRRRVRNDSRIKQQTVVSL